MSLAGWQPPPFRPRAPWWGGDLQTLRNLLVRIPAPPAGERLLLPSRNGSGDRFSAVLNPAAAPRGLPILLLLHGLGGSEDSVYVRAATSYFLGLGYDVLRLNLRGAGPSRASCSLHFNAGRSSDLADALHGLPDALRGRGFHAVAMSVSGNTLLKFLAEDAAAYGVRAAATVSAPVDLTATTRHVLRHRAALYQTYLLRGFRDECLGPGGAVSPAERAVLRRARTFVELDAAFTAPRGGFVDAWDYYRRASASNWLPAIRLPALILQAEDDPIVPAAPLRALRNRLPPNLRVVLTRSGGHVGFHGRNGPWHLQTIAGFLAAADSRASGL